MSGNRTIQTVLPIGDGVAIEDCVDAGMRQLSRQAGRALTPDEEASLRQQLRTALAQGSAMAQGCAVPTACLDYTPEEEREGKDRLQRLLPLARQIAASLPQLGKFAGETLSRALKRGKFKLSDVQEVIVYQSRPSMPQGWHADVVLGRRFPPAADVLGTPVAEPRRTRVDAEIAALRNLAMLVCHAPAPNQGAVRKKWGTTNAWIIAMRRQLMLDAADRVARANLLVQVPAHQEAIAQMQPHLRAEALQQVDRQKRFRLPGVTKTLEISGWASRDDRMPVEFPMMETLVRIELPARGVLSNEFPGALHETVAKALATKDSDTQPCVAEAMCALADYLEANPGYLQSVREHAEHLVAVLQHDRVDLHESPRGDVLGGSAEGQAAPRAKRDLGAGSVLR